MLPPYLCHEAKGSPAHVVCSPSSRCRRAAKHASSWWSRVYARIVRRGGRAPAPACWQGSTSVPLSSPPARRRCAWWLSQRKLVARVLILQTGCGCGIYLRDLECHVDPAIRRSNLGQLTHVSRLMQHGWLEGLLPPLLPSSSFAPSNFFHKSTDPNYTTSTNVLSTVGTRRYE